MHKWVWCHGMWQKQPSNVLEGPVLIYHNIIVNKNNDKYEEHNHDNHHQSKQWFGGRHVLIYHNKDRLGPSVQLIVAHFHNDDDHIDHHDHHDDDHDSICRTSSQQSCSQFYTRAFIFLSQHVLEEKSY